MQARNSGIESKTWAEQFANWLNPEREGLIFKVASAILLLSTGLAIGTELPIIMAIPALLLGLAVWLYDFRIFYYLLLISTPFSLEFFVSDSLATDLPTEPLMLLLSASFLLLFLFQRKRIPTKLFSHPLATLVFASVLWAGICTVFSSDPTVSGKWMLAKVWYVLSFGAVTLMLVQKPEDFKKVFWCLFPGTLFTVVWTLVRHMQMNFSFAEVNLSMEPFFRNHVNYAVYVALFLPFLFLASKWYRSGSWQKILINIAKPLFLASIYFSYTRSSWISVAVGFVAFLTMQRGLIKPAVIVSLLVLFATCTWLLDNNRFLDYAPDFSKTIYHDDFADHMAATTSLEDVSSAERIYRWLAGWYMFLDKPVSGFGPGNFYPYYQNYTVSSFYTYISRNEERSTVHNYYILMMLEQGFMGLVIFFALIVAVLFYAQNIYWRYREKTDKALVLALSFSFVTILVNLFFSDLIEADKIGTLFFALIAIFIALDYHSKRTQETDQVNSQP
jgi:O-antigen ligase